jgi:hypothetical protein
MSQRPRDTSPEAWRRQLDALERLGAVGRLRAAIELSDVVRAIQLEGIQARHPGWSRRDAVRDLVEKLHGIRLPSGR